MLARPNPGFGPQNRLPLADFTASYEHALILCVGRRDNGAWKGLGGLTWGMPTQGHEQSGASLFTKSEAVGALIASDLLGAGGGNERVVGLVVAGPVTE